MLGTCFDFEKHDTRNSTEDTEMLCLVNTSILLQQLDNQQRYGIKSIGSRNVVHLRFMVSEDL